MVLPYEREMTDLPRFTRPLGLAAPRRCARFRESVTLVEVILVGAVMVLVTGQDLARWWG